MTMPSLQTLLILMCTVFLILFASSMLLIDNENNTITEMKSDVKSKVPQGPQIERWKKNLLKLVKTEKPACIIPKLNPFSKDVLRYYSKESPQTCNRKKIAIIKDGTLVVEDKDGIIDSVVISYVVRGRKKNRDDTLDHSYEFHSQNYMDNNFDYKIAINEDNHIHFTDQIRLTKNKEDVYSHLLKDDFVKVKIIIDGETKIEYHSHIANKNTTCLKHGKKLNNFKKGLPFNVAMVMLDAMSHANIRRHFSELLKLIEKDENTMIFEGFGISGDGTTAQLIPALTGLMYDEDLTCSQSATKISNCDELDLIFNDFNKAGYTTMFNEEHTNGGSFQYLLNGFKKPPTDWYLRPYWIAEHEDQHNCGSDPCICESQELLDILKTFTTTCKDEAKFSLTAINQAHDDMNLIQLIQPNIIDIVKFFRQKSLQENTIFILFADHGARAGASDSFRSTIQGKLEELLPFYSIVLPPVFRKKYKTLYNNMKENTEILTSHFDIYSTFKHILSYPDLPKKDKYGQSLFTKINVSNRTCDKAGIPERYCPCLDLKSVDKNSSKVKKVLQAVIDYMNSKLSENKEVEKNCARLTLQYVFNAGMKDSRNEGQVIDTLYEVDFKVSPSNGTFEAHAKITQDGDILVNPSISRTNLYGKQPGCIQHKHRKIAPYCICHDYLKNL